MKKVWPLGTEVCSFGWSVLIDEFSANEKHTSGVKTPLVKGYSIAVDKSPAYRTNQVPVWVTAGVVSKWERGEKQPRGPAAKLLTLAAKNGIAAIA
jgi:hypothetical protein